MLIGPKNNLAKKVIFAILLMWVAFTLYKAYTDVKTYGGCDLRTRVTSTRLLGTDQSPYFYFWKPGDHERFLSPGNKQGELANGNVVTPAVMTVLYPMYQLPYKTIRWLWAILEIGFAIGTILLLLKSAKLKNVYPVALVTIGLLCSDFFLAELERGQMYLGYCFYFSLLYFTFQKKTKYATLISGILGGLFLFFRPFAGIILLPFLIQKEWKWIKGWALGLASGIGLLVLPFQKYWWQYFEAMGKYKQMYFDKIPLQLTPFNFEYPKVIEGMENLGNVKGFNVYVISAAGNFFHLPGLKPSLLALYSSFLFLVLILLYFFKKVHKNAKPATYQVFLLAFALYILAEIFSPSLRAGYNGIQWLFPLLLLLLNANLYKWQLGLLVFCFLLFHNFPLTFGPYMQVGELGLLLLVLTESMKNYDNQKTALKG